MGLFSDFQKKPIGLRLAFLIALGEAAFLLGAVFLHMNAFEAFVIFLISYLGVTYASLYFITRIVERESNS
jgi:membrane protein implicated in regulation of membrane protease activity